jgi:hypothetical protein
MPHKLTYFCSFICCFCRVEDDLNGAMPRKTYIFSRIYLLLLQGGRRSEWCCLVKFKYIFAHLFAFSRIYLLFRAFICRVEDDLNGVMPRSSVELAKLPGVGRYTAAAVGRWNYRFFMCPFLL